MATTTSTASSTSTVVPEHQTIVIEGREKSEKSMVIDLSSAKRRPALSKTDARRLTDEIRSTTLRLWMLVTEAHDRKAHAALGYKTWDDYVRAELHMSPSRSYQLLDTGHVMREMAIAGVDIDAIEPPPARVVSRVKNRLDAVQQVAKAAVAVGDDPEKAVRSLARLPQRNGDDEASGDENGDDEDSTQEPPRRGRPPTLITCPACTGEGKVSRSLGGRLRTFLKGVDST